MPEQPVTRQRGIGGFWSFFVFITIALAAFSARHALRAIAAMPSATNASEYALAVGMIIFNGTLTFAWLVAIVLMLFRARVFRYLYAFLALFSCVAFFTPFFLVRLYSRAGLLSIEAPEVRFGFLTVVALIIGVPYLLISHRARNTFSRTFS